MGVALVMMATGRYEAFVKQAVIGARRWMVDLDQIYLLTDQPHREWYATTALPWGQFAWPLPTLMRYRAMRSYASVLSQHKHILYLDVDMKMVRPVAMPDTQGLLATQHPYFFEKPRKSFTYETNPESSFFVADDEGINYYCGGVQGGASDVYLAATSELSDRIETDLSAGLVPIWHDESAWNRHCIDNPPSVVWSPDYCVPEGSEDENTHIVALNKNHAYLRAVDQPPTRRFTEFRKRAGDELQRRLAAGLLGRQQPPPKQG